jgi:hypothetical protein
MLSLVLGPGAAVVAALTLPQAVTPGLQLLVAVVAAAIAGMIWVPTSPSLRLTAAGAVAAAVPILFRTGNAVDLAGTLGVYAVGTLAQWALLLARGDDQRECVPALTRHFVSASVYAVLFSELLEIDPISTDDGWGLLLPLVVATIAWLAMETGLYAIMEGSRRPLSRRFALRMALEDLDVLGTLIATGALFAIAVPYLHWWALAAAALPYGFAHVAFHRNQATRRTYRQTIRALARIPEVAGLGTEGHADRTAALAFDVARDLGLEPLEVQELEFAALMHDIGRITLTDSSLVAVGYTDDDIARWGAEIIGQAPYLEKVAEHVRRLNEPYRHPGEQIDPSLSLVSKIVRAVSAYDHAVYDRHLTPLEAIETLHQGVAYDFDPEVVASLRRVLEERGAFHPSALTR